MRLFKKDIKKAAAKIALSFIFLLSRENIYSDVERFFPSRDISVMTPAFRGGEIKLTDSKTMFGYIEEVAKSNTHIDYFTLGKSKQGRDIPYLLITEDGAQNVNMNSGKVTVWIQAMQHGDEAGSGEAALNILGYLASDEGKSLLKDINVVIVPRSNMDGAEVGERFNNGKDMNMDHMVLSLPDFPLQKLDDLYHLLEKYLNIYLYRGALLHPQMEKEHLQEDYFPPQISR